MCGSPCVALLNIIAFVSAQLRLCLTHLIEKRVALIDGMSQNAVQVAPPFLLTGGELELLHQPYLLRIMCQKGNDDG